MVKLFGAGAFAVLLAGAAAMYVLTPRGAALPRSAVEEIPAVVQDGDVICRLGDRFWSQLFKNVSPLDRRFSHAGIARVQGGRVTVIHIDAVLSRLPAQKRLEPVFFKEAGKEIIPLESISRSEFFTEVFCRAAQ
ncbi:MAG: hypothetical protein LBT16_04350 [Treponema sp.]|jgi:hypothetical protein|nr:hypothetical protein [Treponema sp.]